VYGVKRIKDSLKIEPKAKPTFANRAKVGHAAYS
jgi:hypothetical protein